MRQTADALFCATIPKGAVFAAVPKSPKNKTVSEPTQPLGVGNQLSALLAF